MSPAGVVGGRISVMGAFNAPRDKAAQVRALVYVMFLMFAMTMDSVGVIIPQVIKTFRLGAAAAGAFQYASTIGVALGGLGLGFLADRLGRKGAILLGLCVYALIAFQFADEPQLRRLQRALVHGRPGHRRLQDGRARAHRRPLPLAERPHRDDEHGRGLLRRGRRHRTRRRHPARQPRGLLEMDLCGGGRALPRADRADAADALSGAGAAQGGRQDRLWADAQDRRRSLGAGLRRRHHALRRSSRRR